MRTNHLIGTLLAFSPLLFPVWAGAQESSNLPDEYLKNLKNYEFVNTRGMKDLAPNRISWVGSGDHAGKEDPDAWAMPTDEEIKKLSEMGIEFPDFRFIEHTDTVAPGQKRQRTHTVEHILYAVPGDAISLYPYYSLDDTFNYFDTFNHWYDYRNGGRLIHTDNDGASYDLLDFPADRGYMQITNDYGFYGGIYMSPGTTQNPDPVIYKVATPQEYINAVNALNNTGGKGSIELTADLNFSGYNDVPMLGDNDGSHFAGVLNGNGHKITNLKIEKNYGGVGLIRYAANGATVANLVIDSSCTFQGDYCIGLIAGFDGGKLTVRNVTVNATIKGTRGGDEDHCTGAILALCDTKTDNQLLFENLYIGATIGNPDMDNGEKHNTVLCGWLDTDNTHSDSQFKNIVFKGTLYGAEDLKGASFIRRVTHEKFVGWDDCQWDGNTFVEKHDDYSILYTDCYGTTSRVEPAWKDGTQYTSFEGWPDSTTPPTVDIPTPPALNLGAPILDNRNHRAWYDKGWYGANFNPSIQERRKAGTRGVFFFPKSLEGEWMSDDSGVTYNNGVKEYVIAADFSQTFEPDNHIDTEAMTVKEPVIAFRHIFRIRDGRKQGDEIYNNNDYIRRHQHKVTARVGTNFQIRLDSPLPTGWGTTGGVTNYYYKKGDDYSRISRFGIKVLDGETHNLLGGEQGFRFGTDIKMYRAEADDNGRHAKHSGEYDYHTMLLRDKVTARAHYIVQVVAKDDSGNVIKGKDGKDMILMEYDITFMPEKGASLVTEAELYSNDNKYKHARDEYLKENYGEPIDKINFDEYIKLNQLTDENLRKKMISYSKCEHEDGRNWVYKDFPVYSGESAYKGGADNTNSSKMYHSFYKWPIRWSRSSYTFGYNYRYDYNMYMLASHSENVPYHAKADEWTANNEGDGNGLYDRLYYKTKRMRETNPNIKQQQGYFYYVNAAADPGVSARLNFNMSCPGSRVIVSAWVAEMSPVIAANGDEPANLSFNFVAVMKNTKERVTLHNFITGYVDNDKLGQWLNVYYSFVPRLAEFYNENMTFDDVDHFELELAHNGTSSAGSDYAIDDIRAYVVPPYSDADHEGYACEDSPLDVVVETSFETLLEKSGKPEAFGDDAGEEMSLYFAFVDKEMVEEAGDLQKAYVKAVLEGDETLPYGTVKFRNNYSKNTPYTTAKKENVIVNNQGYSDSVENGDRMIKFHTQTAGGTLHLGKEYYVVFYSPLDDAIKPAENALNDCFDINGECSYNCSMTVRPSLKIKIDGIIQPEFDHISVCENQSPVIQVNVWSTDKEPVEVEKNAYFDWFDGSINDFENYRFKDYPSSMEILEDANAEEGAKTLKKALEVFRALYSEAESTTGIKPGASTGEEEETLEQWMLDIIDIASAPEASGRTRLLLHQASFVLPPVNLPDDATKAKAKVVAIPIIDLYPAGEYESVCPSPTEVGVTIANRTPILMHGLTGISYPENLADVPLRVVLSQLTKGDGTSLLVSKNRLDLDMPVRKATSTDGKEKAFNLVTEKTLINGSEEERTGCILLAQTNDPEYRNLGTVNEANEETGHLLWVGEITELKAAAHNGGAAAREYFLADFDDAFKFKEGYYYRMRFRFVEEADSNIDADDETVCQGQDVFTIKVVPEYMKWTGDKNLSWDNDDNWRRVASSEISKDNAPSGNALFTDGASNNSRGYAPLPFTKIIVNRAAINENGETSQENPWLYAPTATAKVKDDYTASLQNVWSENPTCAEEVLTEATEDMTAVGNPTSLIQFDMTGYVAGLNPTPELRCRPWTANSCSEIHFLPGATIMGQQHLNYEKAWVDVELDHSRWYLLSTPLKDVYAGDFYLPGDNGRQETELFQEINFDETLNNRFAPAVYQRGWDKGTAKVYEFGKEGSRNAAVKTFWSNVYNDVTEVYGEGNAFSIKTDVEKLAESGDKVLFRLPKADEEYLYYSADGTQSGHKTSLEKTNSYRLNATSGTLTSTTANAGKYFLVGNPFMTHFDIKRFLEANSDKLEQKYWLVTKQGHIAGSISEAGVLAASPYPLTDAPADPSVIAPMQGFFVEAKSDATSIELRYDESMMRRYDSEGEVMTETTRSGNAATSLRIISLNGEEPSSAALLIAAEGEESASADAFDLRDLGIASTVFTACGGRARSINFCSDAEGIEIGVIADDETETTLLFEGTENFGELFLADREENSLTPLAEVKSIKVKGAVSGRFFLTSGIEPTIGGDGLIWRTEGNLLTVTDTASTGELHVTVCDILGRVTADLSTSAETLSISLDKGVSVVKMRNAEREKTIKLNL